MSDKLSQEDIDKLLAGAGSGASSSPTDAGNTGAVKNLDEIQADTIGEIGNIFMGSAATTLSMLVGNRVEITTPKVQEYANIDELFKHCEDSVIVEIKYKTGFTGTTVLVLKASDTAIIADLMMGGDGKNANGSEIGELQMSAVAEAMNQMIGTASTTMSSMFNMAIDITPPLVTKQDMAAKFQIAEDLGNESLVGILFNLKIGDLIDSELIQIMPLSAAKSKIEKLMAVMSGSAAQATATDPEPSPTPQPSPQPMPAQSAPKPAQVSQPAPPPATPVTVQPVQFASFDNSPEQYAGMNKNLELVMDVKLSLTVELGRTELPIKKVLELTRGSVIELDKIAGEPVELFANGKLIAKGEVVVIEDNFGLRITSIISPDSRLKDL